MDILFKTEGLRQLCNEEKVAKKALGPKGARKLRSRLADLDAASRVTELVAGKPHPLKGERAGLFSVRLDGGVRLVFEPANEPIPENDHGGIRILDSSEGKARQICHD